MVQYPEPCRLPVYSHHIFQGMGLHVDANQCHSIICVQRAYGGSALLRLMIRLYRENEVETHNILWKRFLYILFSPLRLTALLSIEFYFASAVQQLKCVVIRNLFSGNKEQQLFSFKEKKSIWFSTRCRCYQQFFNIIFN